MAKYNVRSNCISPFAWSRMIGSIPTETEDQKARVEKLKSMETAKIAPLAVFLASDEAQGRDRPDLRRARERDLPHVAEPAAAFGAPRRGLDAGEHQPQAIPALRAHFYPLDRSQDVFSWDPL